MSQVGVAFVLILGGLLLTPVAERLRVPAPVLTTVFGLLLALLPFVPSLNPSPDLVLPALLPPLLYAAARRTSWRVFISNLTPILILAVVLVFVTAGVITALAMTIHPLLPLGSAIVLGAIVSPPDVAAVTTIASRLGLPRHLVNILEGEGLFNDVTALTLYQVAVAGVVTGSFSVLDSAGFFLYAAGLAIVVGLAVGAAARWLADHLDDPRLTTGVSLMVPYVSYLVADLVHASGVLAVLVTAFLLAAQFDPDDIEGRLTRAPFWDVVELIITAVTFGFVGMELVDILRSAKEAPGAWLWQGLAIAVAVVVVRALWMLGTMWLARWRVKWTGQPIGWRTTVVMSWAGMRGVVTVVTALALPTTLDNGEPFTARDQILYIAMSVVVLTLLLQGLSLRWVVHVTGVRRDSRSEEATRREAVAIATDAAGKKLDGLVSSGDLEPEAIERVKAWHVMQTSDLLSDPVAPEDPGHAARLQTREQIRDCQDQMLTAARAALLQARASTDFDPGVIDEIVEILDIRGAGRRR